MNILVAKNGSQLGPFSEGDIHAKLASGELAPTDLGWKEGMAAWSPLSTMFAAPPPAPAAPPPQAYPPQGQNNPGAYAPQSQPQSYPPQPQQQPYPPQGQPQPYSPQPQQQPYNAPQGQYSAPQTYNSPYPAQYQQGAMPPWGAPGGVVYAGFWLRFVAFIIDAIILGIPAWLVRTAVFSATSDPYIFSMILNGRNYGYTYASPITFLIALAYYGAMESSNLQATVGKLALGLKVTDLNGNRLSFGRAAARYAAQILSDWTLTIGYMMAGFTQRKQALHDIVVGALVVKK